MRSDRVRWRVVGLAFRNGAYVELEALMDLICVVSSCPFDLPVEGWTINASGGPTELVLDLS